MRSRLFIALILGLVPAVAMAGGHGGGGGYHGGGGYYHGGGGYYHGGGGWHGDHDHDHSSFSFALGFGGVFGAPYYGGYYAPAPVYSYYGYDPGTYYAPAAAAPAYVPAPVYAPAPACYYAPPVQVFVAPRYSYYPHYYSSGVRFYYHGH